MRFTKQSIARRRNIARLTDAYEQGRVRKELVYRLMYGVKRLASLAEQDPKTVWNKYFVSPENGESVKMWTNEQMRTVCEKLEELLDSKEALQPCA